MPLFGLQNTDLLEISKDGKGHMKEYTNTCIFNNLYKISLPCVLRAWDPSVLLQQTNKTPINSTRHKAQHNSCSLACTHAG